MGGIREDSSAENGYSTDQTCHEKEKKKSHWWNSPSDVIITCASLFVFGSLVTQTDFDYLSHQGKEISLGATDMTCKQPYNDELSWELDVNRNASFWTKNSLQAIPGKFLMFCLMQWALQGKEVCIQLSPQWIIGTHPHTRSLHFGSWVFLNLH